MGDLNSYTPTELLKLINNLNDEHSKSKNLILNKLDDIQNLEIEINKLIEKLNKIETLYNTVAKIYLEKK